MFRRAVGLAVGATCAGVGVAYADAVPALSPVGLKQPSKTLPGVYLWGNNKHRLISDEEEDAVKIPTPVPFLDNTKLRDLCVADSGEAAVAVLANGNCVQWDSTRKPTTILKGVVSVKAAGGDTIVALSKSGTVYTWSSKTKKLQKLKLPSLGWFEKIVQIDTGDSHVACLTSKGKILTGFVSPVENHSGQIGIASFPSFDPAPAPYELRHVSLLPERATSVACGSEHTLVRAASGQVYGFGSNALGQLMQQYSFKTAALSTPTPVPSSNVAVPDGLFPVRHVAAGGEVSYLSNDTTTFVGGNGIHGQFGTGSFAHCQVSPLRIGALSDLREYSEAVKAVVPLSVERMSVGASHTFAKLSNGDWLVWGSNESGQLGNGRLSKIVRPQFARSLPMAEYLGPEDVFVAGNNVSACYKSSTSK